jgi:hypothetical protein
MGKVLNCIVIFAFTVVLNWFQVSSSHRYDRYQRFNPDECDVTEYDILNGWVDSETEPEEQPQQDGTLFDEN